MNTLNLKNISVALLFSLGAIFSVNANAAQTSNIEASLTEMLVAQSQVVMNDVSMQLQQSIQEELNSFSIDFSFDETLSESIAWLTDEKESTEIVEVKKNN
jgi:hypothetical protein